MDSATTIRRLHEHRLWTRAKLLAAARTCTHDELTRPFEMGMGSLLATLTHLWGAEMVWACVLEQHDPAQPLPPIDKFATLDALEAAWPALDARWAQILAHAADPAYLAQPKPRIRDGKTYTTNAHDILVHVCTHQHYHAAQVSNMLRQMGKQLPPCDLIFMAREQWTA